MPLFRYIFVFCHVIWALLLLPVFAWAAPAPEEFGKLPAIYDAAISPNGKRVAIFQNINGSYGLRVINLDSKDKKVSAVMLGDGVKPQWIKWVNNNRVLASIWDSQKIKGTPITTGFIYTLDADNMKGKLLIRPKGILRQYNNTVIDFLESDPDHILMSFSDDNVGQPDIQKVNVANARYKRIQNGRRGIQYWQTDLTGKPRVGQGLRSQSKEDWKLILRMAESDKWQSYEEFPGLEPDTDIYGFTKNPNEMVIASRAGKSTTGLYIYDLSQKRQTRKLFHNDNYDVSGVILNSDGDEIIGASYVADDKEVELFGANDSTLERLRRKYPEFTIDYIDQDQAGDKILIKMSNPYDPGGLFLLNGQTDEMKLLADNYTGLDSDDLGVVIPVRYTARDGTKIPAYVTLPPTITDSSKLKNLPFIILPHGGPYARSTKRFDYFAQFFSTRGFGVLQMNFRGSTGYGKTYEDAGRQNWVVMQEDVEDGTRWLIKKGYADPKRTCIAGWSYGGYAALMGVIKDPDLYACAISMAGVTDLNELIRDIKKYTYGKITAKSVTDGFEDKDAMKANSPMRRADEIKTPLFLAHGTLDQRVHFDQYSRMKKALKKSPAKVTFMEFKDEDHFLPNQKNRERFFKGLDKFLTQSVGVSEFKKN